MNINTKNGQYPYAAGDLVRDNPDTSFPADITLGLLAEWGVYPVAPVARPTFNPATQAVDELAPALVGGVWTQQWAVRAATQAEMDAYAAEQAAAAQAVADQSAKAEAKADATIKYLVTHTPAQIAAKVDADITNLAAAKAYIAKLAVAVSVLAREELR